MSDYTSLKRCTKCHGEKPVDQFYKLKNRSLQSWCKDCLRKDNAKKRRARRLSYRVPTAISTLLAQDILRDHRIPACPGIVFDFRSIDLLAWACVPVEAKLSREKSRPNRFVWTFTIGQLEKLAGVIMLIAQWPDRRRVFIIPANDLRGLMVECSTHFGVTIDAQNARSLGNWQLLRKYEDRYDLIEIERSAYADGNR